MDMTTVAIVPVSDASGEKIYRAIRVDKIASLHAGDKQSTGRTAGEVLFRFDCPGAKVVNSAHY